MVTHEKTQILPETVSATTVDLQFWSTTMVDDLILVKCQPSANHCALEQVSSTQLVQNVFLSKSALRRRFEVCQRTLRLRGA